jgi:hypothetical protein
MDDEFDFEKEMAGFQQEFEGWRRTGEELADIALRALAPDLHYDAPLSLADAVCLPELGGVYTSDPELRSRSESISVKALRKAIDDGHLQCVRPNSKNLYVTRAQIREWLDKCRDPRSRPTSSFVLPAATVRAASRTRPSGTSTTTAGSTSLDAARKIVQELRERSRTTSSGSTPKK